jgi:hypothetical protein
MKKYWLAILGALLAVALLAAPALAWGGTETGVTCGDIEVSNPNPVVGATVTFSGTVDIVSEASATGFISSAYAGSDAWYCVTAPDGSESSGNNLITDYNVGLLSANADGSQTYGWSIVVRLMQKGIWTVGQGGSAEAWYFSLLPLGYDYSEDCSAVSLNIKPHTTTILSSHPVLIIETPDGRGCYFASDGWDGKTTQDIVLDSGGWKVQIDKGTIYQMDGKWHKRSWLIIDQNGAVTGKYGNGERLAENIGLSKPITITKQ